MNETKTNGHTNGNAVTWMRAADLPDHLGGAVIPTVTPDTSHVWEKGQQLDPAAARAAFEQAREMAELQDEYADDIEAALSPADLAADDAARRKVRTARRDHETARELDRVNTEAARARHEKNLRETRERQAEEVATMRLTVVRETNPAHNLARLNLARWLAPTIALVPAGFAAVAEAVNVGTAMGELSPNTGVINWSLGPLFTVPLVAIMVAQLLGAVPMLGRGGERGTRNRFVTIELALFVVTVVMNVGPHLLAGDPIEHTLPWLSVPAGFALSMYLVPALREHLNVEFVRAAESAKEWLTDSPGTNADEVRPTPSDLHGTNRDEGAGTNGGTNSGTNSSAFVPDPEHESLDSIRARLRALVEAGEFDPHRVSVNAARESLGVRRERAEEALIAEYGRPDLVERRRRREEKKKGSTRSS